MRSRPISAALTALIAAGAWLGVSSAGEPAEAAGYCAWASVKVGSATPTTVRSGSACPPLPPPDRHNPCPSSAGTGPYAKVFWVEVHAVVCFEG